MSNKVSHAGQFLYNLPSLLGIFHPGPSAAYLFSKPLNWLDLEPSYPKNPSTLGEYIRKWRMEQGISQVELAERIGVNEMTIVNWEVRRRSPCPRCLERLIKVISGLPLPDRNSNSKNAV